MKGLLKILKYLLITIIVILLLLFTASMIFQGRVTQIFSNEANKFIETDIVVEKVGFSLLKGFPKATVEFKNVRIKSPVSENKWLDNTISENDFLTADLIYASFNVRDLLKKNYSIDRISMKNCNVFIFSDSIGISTNRITKESNRGDSSKVSFDLKNIRLENTAFKYHSSKNHFVLDCSVDNASGKVSLDKGTTVIMVKTDYMINLLSSSDNNILNPGLAGKIDGGLDISADSVHFKQIELNVDNQVLGLKGSIYQKARKISLDINTKELDLDRLLTNIPLDTEFNSGANIKSLSARFALDFDNPGDSFFSTIHSYHLEYAGSLYSGSLSFGNLKSPLIDLKINGDLNLGELHRIHSFPNIKSLDGKAHINARLRGSPGNLGKISIGKILDLERSINLHLTGVNLELQNYHSLFHSMNGNIMIADNLWGDEVSFMLAEQNIVMNFMVAKFNNLFSKESGSFDITAGIWADRLDIASLIPGKNTEEEEEKNNSPSTFGQRINASLTLNIDSLLINDFHSSQFDGIINYRPGFLNINSFNLLALEGSLSGNAALIRNSGGDYMARGWFDIARVDINKAFTVFKNFGQEQIIAENLKGNLSGSVSISTVADSNFKLNPSGLSLTGNYTILDGELINFEPVMKLSRFIEVSELENIKFENLHNDLIISDQRLIIPSMEINSSAFNISVSGEQEFSGEFEYHLQVLLSDILSRKARNSGSYVSEFGPVEDDGLGRTTLFLKLEKDGGETRVSYDVKKLSEEIKVSLKEEKQTLKTILNEEYGWYNNDSIVSTTKSNSRKFRITWEEADSVKTIEQNIESSRQGLLKKIFKPDTTKKKF